MRRTRTEWWPMSFGMKMAHKGLIQQPQTEVDMDMWATTVLYEAEESEAVRRSENDIARYRVLARDV